MSTSWTCPDCGRIFSDEGYKYAHIDSKACKKNQEIKRKELSMTLDGFQIEELKFGIIHGIRGANYEKPFYWTANKVAGSAPSGWYQWTKTGIVYLGESILERA